MPHVYSGCPFVSVSGKADDSERHWHGSLDGHCTDCLFDNGGEKKERKVVCVPEKERWGFKWTDGIQVENCGIFAVFLTTLFYFLRSDMAQC